MSFQLHHFHLLCSDLEKAEQFFIQKFGARAEGRTTFGSAQGSMLNLCGIKIYLRTAKPQEKVSDDGSSTGYGWHHLGLQVEDLASVCRDLQASGVEFSVPPKETANGRLAFVKGPDNILIELFQPED